jgi:UTP:GlnB (protein PII) uridylyltransferase
MVNCMLRMLICNCRHCSKTRHMRMLLTTTQIIRILLTQKNTFFTKVVQSVGSLQEEALEEDETNVKMTEALLESQHLSGSMDFTKTRDTDMYRQSITPLLKCEQEKMDALISRFPRSRSRRA